MNYLNYLSVSYNKIKKNYTFYIDITCLFIYNIKWFLYLVSIQQLKI